MSGTEIAAIITAVVGGLPILGAGVVWVAARIDSRKKAKAESQAGDTAVKTLTVALDTAQGQLRDCMADKQRLFELLMREEPEQDVPEVDP